MKTCIQSSNMDLSSLVLRIFSESAESESEVKVKVAQSSPTLFNSMDYTVHGILHARILEWVAFPFSRGSSQPGMEPRSPTLQVDSLPAESQGSPRIPEWVAYPFLQRIFPTQEVK